MKTLGSRAAPRRPARDDPGARAVRTSHVEYAAPRGLGKPSNEVEMRTKRLVRSRCRKTIGIDMRLATDPFVVWVWCRLYLLLLLREDLGSRVGNASAGLRSPNRAGRSQTRGGYSTWEAELPSSKDRLAPDVVPASRVVRSKSTPSVQDLQARRSMRRSIRSSRVGAML